MTGEFNYDEVLSLNKIRHSTIAPLYCHSINFILNITLKDMMVKDIQLHFRIGYNRVANTLEQIKRNNQPIK
ncbi:hypothetical protein F0T03_12130 [Yersinia canariae]|uniref:Uncharacterized protein n=1 Tax=Yersinia canariae TaxID=2607663 RepID=A0A857F0S0_9GAMM|nr:hypothetical protein [Yersinia canariae]QHB32844.1 hypothetical protein F0T03_12130 [Yersinia canariae]